MTNLIGTASRTDKTLIESGRFYPKGTKIAEARLREANFVPLSPLSFLERSASVYPGHIALIYATRRQTCFACVNSGALPTGRFWSEASWSFAGPISLSAAVDPFSAVFP